MNLPESVDSRADVVVIGGFFALKDRVRYFGIPMSELGITLVERHGGDGTIGAGAVLGSEHPNFFNHVWQVISRRRVGLG